jgi:hypothetical protein
VCETACERGDPSFSSRAGRGRLIPEPAASYVVFGRFVPNVSKVRDRTGQVLAHTYIQSTYHNGLPSFAATPGLNEYTKGALRYIFAKVGPRTVSVAYCVPVMTITILFSCYCASSCTCPPCPRPRFTLLSYLGVSPASGGRVVAQRGLDAHDPYRGQLPGLSGS